MRCGKCGADNPGYAIFCGVCGNDLPRTPAASETTPSVQKESTVDVTEQPSKQSLPEMRFCTKCGKQISASSFTCAFCGQQPWGPDSGGWERIYSSTSEDYSYSEAPPRSDSSAPIIGGIFAILAGILALGQGLLYLAGTTLIEVPGTGVLCVCGGLDVVFGGASLFGGICALKRQSYGMAMTGAILGMLGFGMMLGFIFGLIAVILIGISKEEF